VFDGVHGYVSEPIDDLLAPPPHNTGGAVDLTIVDGSGAELRMGTVFDEFSDRAHPDYFIQAGKDDPDAQVYHQNRLLLRDAMVEVGFVEYPYEWWHYSYGNQQWAQATKSDTAIYGRIHT